MPESATKYTQTSPANSVDWEFSLTNCRLNNVLMKTQAPGKDLVRRDLTGVKLASKKRGRGFKEAIRQQIPG